MTILIFFGLMYLTWVLYLAAMAFMPACKNGTAPVITRYMFVPVLLVGVICDITLNMMMSIPFLELPRELMLTWRCERLLKSGSGYRKRLATFICHKFLDPFAVGGHCKPE